MTVQRLVRVLDTLDDLQHNAELRGAHFVADDLEIAKQFVKDQLDQIQWPTTVGEIGQDVWDR